MKDGHKNSLAKEHWIIGQQRIAGVVLATLASIPEIFPKVVDGRDSSSGEFGSIFEDHSGNDLRQQRAAVEFSPMILS